jgi:hypothetical protein
VTPPVYPRRVEDCDHTLAKLSHANLVAQCEEVRQWPKSRIEGGQCRHCGSYVARNLDREATEVAA